MRAVGYRIARDLRTRWRAAVLLSTIVAVVTGVVIAFAAGAHRTTTIPERYRASVGLDVDVEVTQEEGGPPRTAEVRSLPGVVEAESYTFVFGGLKFPGSTEYADALVFAGSELAVGARIIAGRPVDPAVEGEFVGTPSLLEQSGAELGDQFDLVTFTQEQGDAGEFPFGEPAGPRLTGTLVGIAAGPQTIEDSTPIAVFAPSLLDRSDIGVSQTTVLVSLREDVDAAMFRRQLDTLPDSATLSIAPAEVIPADMERAISTQARGMWILATVAAIAAVAVLGQVITRQMRLSIPERQQLSAIGFTDRQVLTETASRAAVPILLGCVAGGALAAMFSGMFPTGFIRKLEPESGLLVMWSPMLLIVAVLAASLLVWVVTSLMLAHADVRSVKPSSTVEAITARWASAAAGIGMRFAFTRATGERGSVRAALAGVMLTLCGLVAAITFGASVDRLIDEPYRFGGNYDVAMGDNGGEQIDPLLAQTLLDDPDVTSLMFYAAGYGRAGDHTVPLSGLEVIRGEGTPIVLAGRLPTGDDEIALGRVTAGKLGVSIGDSLELVGPTSAQVFRITGLVVVTGLGANEGIGEGGVVMLPGLERLDSSAAIISALVQFRPGSPGVETYAPMFPNASQDELFRPAAIVNIDRVRAIPFILASLLAVLAVLTVAHGMFTSLRARCRDVAVLRSMGADRSFVFRAAHWQATAFSTVPALIGAPVGFVVGRAVFGRYADGIGAVNTASMPGLVVLAMIVGIVLLANVVAAFPARRASRVPTAALLQTE